MQERKSVQALGVLLAGHRLAPATECEVLRKVYRRTKLKLHAVDRPL
ncbi:hypothetical protein ABZS59_30455 [Streptomyces flaveolus]